MDALREFRLHWSSIFCFIDSIFHNKVDLAGKLRRAASTSAAVGALPSSAPLPQAGDRALFPAYLRRFANIDHDNGLKLVLPAGLGRRRR